MCCVMTHEQDRGGKGCDSHQPLTDCMCLVMYNSQLLGCKSFICSSFTISCKMSHCFFLFLGIYLFLLWPLLLMDTNSIFGGL